MECGLVKPIIVAMMFTVALAQVAGAAGAAPAKAEPAEVVQAFNRALTARKLQDATALLAAGSVQFTLRAAHAGVTAGQGGITSDLRTHWNQIGPVLFAVTTTYRRVPKILDTRVDGDLATVWAQVATETVERGGKTNQASFSELYLLVKTADGWRIGGIADNRGTDNLAVSDPPSQ